MVSLVTLTLRNTTWFWAITTSTDGPDALVHTPLASVWHTLSVSGRRRGGCPNGVSVAVNVTVPATPMLTAATTIACVAEPWPTGGNTMLPSWVVVSATATTSGPAVVVVESRKVSSPK